MKKKPFKIRRTSNKLLIRQIKAAREIRQICRDLSNSSRRKSLEERFRLRKIINSLLRNSGLLEGRA